MHILIVGTGYVGLVTAACFSEMGHHVTCLDIDEKKITRLHRGEIPIFEPGLQEIVERNTKARRLTFTTDYQKAVQNSSVCFLCLPTPSKEDGSCDLSYVFNAAQEIASHMNGDQIFVTKSTVPVGTAYKLKAHIALALQKRGVHYAFDVVSNPEFLKEGCAVNDCMKPDRIILGVESEKSAKVMREIYSSFTINRDRIFIMDPLSAEMTKYAANAMLATRISFMNELAALCERVGANINDVRIGIGSDQRIGFQFLYAGAGYGGSCFPKDIRALCATAEEHELPLSILSAVDAVNERQKQHFVEKIVQIFSFQGSLKGKKIAVWGLSFKPDTDDMREAPSLVLIHTLLAHGASLRLYDPIAMSNARKLLPLDANLTFCKDEYEAALDVDAIVLMTEWKQFRFVNFNHIVPHLRQHYFFDGRNQYSPAEMQKLGLIYFGIGIPSPQGLLERFALHPLIEHAEK